MAWKFLPYLAAAAFAAFAAILFRLFSRGGDQARSTEESASGNDGTAGYDYEVFLSFRGPDTRSGFTDFLYTSLKGAGIRTFKDDENLRKGVKFAPELLQAIEQSKILIPIFSKDYASSVWCLKEVVQMVECKKNKGKMIMPIFYDVAPSEVRHQSGNYEEPFRSHERKKRYDQKTIREWKKALRAVADINGWELPRDPTRREGESVRTITWKVVNELKKASLVVSNYLVGVDHHVDEIMEMIGAWTSETRIIGITGMGGIGKTTIAKIVYNKLLEKFDNCCFLPNIREMSEKNGIECLQNQLISDILKEKWTNIRNSPEGTQTISGMLCEKKVLILLDDVDKKKHMDALVGSRDWFGKGSKLIITTRNKEVLVHRVDKIYEVNIMDTNQSLQLFSKHAFREDHPSNDDMNQSMRAINIAGGLPLAIEVLGSFLSTIDKKKWNDHLAKLESDPHEDVQSKLKISYDVLEDEVKHIFLDIACLLIGYDKDILVHFWESKFHPKCAFDVLETKCLIKIKEDNKVWMHDQLRDIGRQIVSRQRNIEEITRMWNAKDALELLKRQEMKKKLEALHLPLDHQHCFAYEDFRRLPNLKFLDVCDTNETSRNKSLSSVLPTDVFQENSDLLPELRWLAWPNIPPTFKIMNFSMRNVVILDLSESRITHDWKGWSHMKVMKNLKVMDLHSCFNLKRTPNFSTLTNLERLILHNCYKLDEIDESICRLKNLVFLDVSHCRNLQRLPNTIGELKSLIELDILETDSIGNLESLIELDISYSKITELPDSIKNFTNLKVVKMNGCSMSKIPDALWRIKELEVIEVTAGCHLDVKIGDGIYGNRALRILKLDGARINNVPRLPGSLTILKLSNLYMNTFPDLSNLTTLEKLELRFVRRDSDGKSDGPVEEDPPRWIGYLSKLKSLFLKDPPPQIGNLSKLKSLFLESPYVTALPDISLLPHLRFLTLRCPDLRRLPSLPSSLSFLDLNSERVTTLPKDMSSLLPRLEKLHLACPNLNLQRPNLLPRFLSLPSNLTYLGLESKCVTTLPKDMSSLLPRLELLRLECPSLRRLPSLPSSLCSIRLDNCKSCRSMGDLSNLKTLKYLEISECAISEIQGLHRLENLKTLELGKLQQLEILPDLRILNKLWRLQVSDCGNLVEIQGEFPSSLEALDILDCGSLQKLPDLSSLEELPSLLLKRCKKLDVEAIYSLYPKEEVEFEGDDSESGCEFDEELEGEDDESGCEFDDELEGEDDESGCEFDDELEGEDDESMDLREKTDG